MFWQNCNNRLKQESTPFNLLKWSVHIPYVLGLFRTSWVRQGGCELIRGSTTAWLADQDEHIIKMLIKGQDLSHFLLATKSDVHLVHLVSDPPRRRIHEQIIMDGGRGQGMMIGLLDTFKVKGDERRGEKKSHKCSQNGFKWCQVMFWYKRAISGTDTPGVQPERKRSRAMIPFFVGRFRWRRKNEDCTIFKAIHYKGCQTHIRVIWIWGLIKDNPVKKSRVSYSDASESEWKNW